MPNISTRISLDASGYIQPLEKAITALQRFGDNAGRADIASATFGRSAILASSQFAQAWGKTLIQAQEMRKKLDLITSSPIKLPKKIELPVDPSATMEKMVAKIEALTEKEATIATKAAALKNKRGAQERQQYAKLNNDLKQFINERRGLVGQLSALDRQQTEYLEWKGKVRQAGYTERYVEAAVAQHNKTVPQQLNFQERATAQAGAYTATAARKANEIRAAQNALALKAQRLGLNPNTVAPSLAWGIDEGMKEAASGARSRQKLWSKMRVPGEMTEAQAQQSLAYEAQVNAGTKKMSHYAEKLGQETTGAIARHIEQRSGEIRTALSSALIPDASMRAKYTETSYMFIEAIKTAAVKEGKEQDPKALYNALMGKIDPTSPGAEAQIKARATAVAANPELMSYVRELDRYQKEGKISDDFNKLQKQDIFADKLKGIRSRPEAFIQGLIQSSRVSRAYAETGLPVEQYKQNVEQIIAGNSDLIRSHSSLAQEVYALERTAIGAHTNMSRTWYNLSNVWRLTFARILTFGFYQLTTSMRASFQRSVELSRGIGEIQTISQEASISTERWRQGVEQLSNQYNFLIEDVTEGLYEAISNQIAKGEQALQFMARAAQFGKATKSTLTDSMNLLSSALNAYSMSAYETERASAILFRTIELGRVRANEMANNFGRVTATASMAGVSLEEVAAMISEITIRGVKFERASTFIINVMNKLLKPSEKMSEVIAELGATSGEALIQMLGPIGIMQKLAERGTGVQEIAELFKDIRATGGVALLLKDPENLAATLTKVTDSMELYLNAQDKIIITPGEKIAKELNYIRNAVQSLTETLIEGVVGLADYSEKLTGTRMGVAGGLLSIIGGLAAGTTSHTLLNIGRGAAGKPSRGGKASLLLGAAAIYGTGAMLNRTGALGGKNERPFDQAYYDKVKKITIDLDKQTTADKANLRQNKSIVSTAWNTQLFDVQRSMRDMTAIYDEHNKRLKEVFTAENSLITSRVGVAERMIKTQQGAFVDMAMNPVDRNARSMAMIMQTMGLSNRAGQMGDQAYSIELRKQAIESAAGLYEGLVKSITQGRQNFAPTWAFENQARVVENWIKQQTDSQGDWLADILQGREELRYRETMLARMDDVVGSLKEILANGLPASKDMSQVDRVLDRVGKKGTSSDVEMARYLMATGMGPDMLGASGTLGTDRGQYNTAMAWYDEQLGLTGQSALRAMLAESGMEVFSAIAKGGFGTPAQQEEIAQIVKTMEMATKSSVTSEEGRAELANVLLNGFADLNTTLARVTAALDDKDRGRLNNLYSRIDQEALGLVQAQYAPPAMAKGGPVGTDTVPAWLTPGEFVINKRAAAAYMPFLQSINRYADGGSVYDSKRLKKRNWTDVGGGVSRGYKYKQIDRLGNRIYASPETGSREDLRREWIARQQANLYDGPTAQEYRIQMARRAELDHMMGYYQGQGQGLSRKIGNYDTAMQATKMTRNIALATAGIGLGAKVALPYLGAKGIGGLGSQFIKRRAGASLAPHMYAPTLANVSAAMAGSGAKQHWLLRLLNAAGYSSIAYRAGTGNLFSQGGLVKGFSRGGLVNNYNVSANINMSSSGSEALDVKRMVSAINREVNRGSIRVR